MKKRLFLTLALLAITTVAYPRQTQINDSLVGSYLKGIMSLNKGDIKGAAEEFEKAKKIDPESSYLRLKLGFIFLKLGEDEKAEAELKKAKELDPNNLEASTALILLYASKKREKELEAEYRYFLERAHSLRPENIRISEYLGQYYFYKSMPHEAIKVYTAIVAQKPDYAEGYFWLGYFYEETGQRDKAIKMWKKTLELNPNHSDALNSLGYIYAEKGIKLDEAEKMVNKALEFDPQNGAYLDSLGWVYYKKGDYKKAENCLLKAVQYLKEAVVYEHLGDVYVKLKDLGKALFYYKKAQEVAPDNNVLEEKIKKYEGQSKKSKEEG